jgi:signal transduction histidine kinase/ActR/RegA family two-component response regulator
VTTNPELVLVWAPRGRDGALASQLLNCAGLVAEECRSIDEVIAQMASIGCVVFTSEALAGSRDQLAAALASQPPWSDFPIVLFAPRGADRADEALEAVRLLGNVTILDRPVHSGTLVSAVVAALRGRRRQYEAREAIHRRDQFLAMLGHELRNPLAAIVLALETMPPLAVDPAAKQRLIIDRQARHLARLVDDLLDVARVTSGKVRLQREPIDLNEVVERCIHGAELAARTRSIELRQSLAPGTLIVDGDVLRLEEVFSNLIGNAMKYSPSGARIDLRTSRNAGRCTVEVSDRGIGIAPDMLERVFDLFAQADASLDRSQGGLGVGLTLVRSLVELHEGTVKATSAGLGHGSTFTVSIPASAPSVRRSSGSHLTLVEPALAVNVVLVEDNSDLLEMTKDLLEHMGCVVSTASDGAAGLAQILAAPPDIAFIDIGLPGLDGYQIAHQVRAQLGGDLFLVAMTGYGQPEDQQRTRDAGFDLHLTKPVTAKLLQQGLAACANVRSAGRAHTARKRRT